MYRQNFVQRTSHITSEFVFETRLREDVKKVCDGYIRDCQRRWTQLGRNNARAKMQLASDLILSANNDGFNTFTRQIVSSLNWLDQNNHDSTRLRRPFEEYNEALRNRQVTTFGRSYGQNNFGSNRIQRSYEQYDRTSSSRQITNYSMNSMHNAIMFLSANHYNQEDYSDEDNSDYDSDSSSDYDSDSDSDYRDNQCNSRRMF